MLDHVNEAISGQGGGFREEFFTRAKLKESFEGSFDTQGILSKLEEFYRNTLDMGIILEERQKEVLKKMVIADIPLDING